MNVVVMDVELGRSCEGDELFGFTIFVFAVVMGHSEMFFQVIVFFVENILEFGAANVASEMVSHVDNKLFFIIQMFVAKLKKLRKYAKVYRKAESFRVFRLAGENEEFLRFAGENDEF